MLSRGHHICLQIFSSLFANLLNVTYGLSLGWFIIYSGKFTTFENPLEVPTLLQDEVRWINLSFYIGALFGTIFWTVNSDVFGRKYTLVVLIVPQGFGWMLKMFSTNATETYLGSALSGLTAGGSVNLVLLFVAELADDRIRGRLGSLLPLSINMGLLVMFISDLMLSYMQMAFVTFGVLFVFLCTYTFFPDTPRQLYKIRRKEQAIRSLQLYRDIRDLERQTDDCYQIEVKKIRQSLISEKGLTFKNSRYSIAVLKCLTICLILLMLNVYVNWLILSSLTEYEALERNQLNSNTFRIIIGICQLVGSVLCMIFVDFVERKHLLIGSIAGITVSQMVYGVILLFSQSYTNLPEMFIAAIAFSLHFGVYPLTFVLIPEIIPERIRIYGVSFVFSLFWMLIFSMSQWKTVNILIYRREEFLLICILFNSICSVILWTLLPPTKRRSYDDIFRYLNSELR